MLVGLGAIACRIHGGPSVSAVQRSVDPSTVAIQLGKPDPTTGSVRVRLNVRDGAKLHFTIPAKTSKAAISSRTGPQSSTTAALTYTPNPIARHQAASESAGADAQFDRVAIRVTDQDGKSTILPVRIPVSPKNQAPTAEVLVGAPNAVGIIEGKVIAVDPDGDPLMYNVSSPPTRGSVTLKPDGAFTYTPAASVPRLLKMNQVVDSFTVTVGDGHGGSIAIPITCPGPG